RFLHRHALHLVRALGATDIKSRSQQSLANEIEVFRPEVSVRFAVELLKLPQLFGERHLGEDGVDALFDVLGWGTRKDQRTEGKQKNYCKANVSFHMQKINSLTRITRITRIRIKPRSPV